jgi:hypothetical protein
MRKSTFVAMATALSLALGGLALAQPAGTGAPQGASPPLDRGIDSQGMERGAVPGGPERDARPGIETPRDLTSPQPAPAEEPVASESRIRSLLEKQGYGNVQNIRREGEAYIATATKGGETVTVRVDPQLGQIQEHGG